MGFIASIFYKVLYMSIIGTLIGISILIIRKILDKKISPRWKCVMWGIMMISLLIPLQFKIKNANTNMISISGLIEPIQNISYTNEYQRVQREIERQNEVIKTNNSKENLENLNILNNTSNNLEIQSIIFDNVIPGIWIIGVILYLLLLIIENIKINKSIKTNEFNDKRIKNILESCKEELKIKAKIRIILQNFKKSPCIIGIFKSKILINEELLNMDDDSIKYVLMHELSHFKRKDMIFNYLLILVTAIHWFNPFVWLCFKKIRQDIEVATDEVVLTNLKNDEKQEYGMTLIRSLQVFEEEKYTARILCVTDDFKNVERRVTMIKLADKFKENKVIIGVISIIIILTLGIVFFIQTNKAKETNLSLSAEQTQEENKPEYEYKLFKPIFGISADDEHSSYDFTQDMTYQKTENIYYKKLDNYTDYAKVKNRWNDILDMTENDFSDKFMVISAIENTSMLGLTLNKIETDDNCLYISLIKDEKFPADDENSTMVSSSKQTSNEENADYNNTCISYVLPKTMEREKIVVTRELRNDEKDFGKQMQLAELKDEDHSPRFSFQYKDKSYVSFQERTNNSNTIKIIEPDWKDMILKRFSILKNNPEIDYSNWKTCGDRYHYLEVTEYSQYVKLMNNYNVTPLTWNDFKSIYVIVMVSDSSDYNIGISDLKTDENGKTYLEVYNDGVLDVTEEFKYPATTILLPNYRSTEELYFKVE